MKPHTRLKVALLYALCCAIWGSTWLVIKLGLADLPPFWFAGIRMGFACLVLTPLAWKAGLAKLSRSELRRIAFCGLLQIGATYALVFEAEKTIDSGLTAVLFATFPIWLALISHAVLPDDALTPAGVLSAAIGFGGVIVLEWPAISAFVGKHGTAAALLPLAGAVLSAISNVVMKKHLSAVSPAANLWGQALVGALFLLALAAAVREPFPLVWSAKAIACLLYLSLAGTVTAFLALFWLIPRISMSAVGAIPVIDTLVAVALGAVVLSEPLTGRFVAGALLILLAAGLANRPARVSAA